MIRSLIERLLRAAPAEGPPPRQRLVADRSPAALYAIGDVHGHLDLLLELERQIMADAVPLSGEKWIVMLGDYVDRGPQSSAVLDHLLVPLKSGWRRICLCGNHEHAMAAAMVNRKDFARWLEFGGVETLMSYGLSRDDIYAARDSTAAHARLVEAFIPQEHVAFLARLPVLLQTPDYIFVHAGLRPQVAIEDQAEQDLLWFRDPQAPEFDFGKVVVHGHTPVAEPLVTAHRVNLDTGAYATGRLTAMFFGEQPRFLQSRQGLALSDRPRT